MKKPAFVTFTSIAFYIFAYYLVAMKVQEFRSLDDTEKAVVLINNGVLVGKRTLQFYLVFLYHMDSFYVEIIYNKQTNFVYKFKAFENTELLEPYLSRIDISWVEEFKH